MARGAVPVTRAPVARGGGLGGGAFGGGPGIRPAGGMTRLPRPGDQGNTPVARGMAKGGKVKNFDKKKAKK